MSVSFLKQPALNTIVSNLLTDSNYSHWKSLIGALYGKQLTIADGQFVKDLLESLNVDAYNLNYGIKNGIVESHEPFVVMGHSSLVYFYKVVYAYNYNVDIGDPRISDQPMFRIMQNLEKRLAWMIIAKTDEYKNIPREVE